MMLHKHNNAAHAMSPGDILSTASARPLKYMHIDQDNDECNDNIDCFNHLLGPPE